MSYKLQKFLEACDPALPAAGDYPRSRHFVDRKDGFRVELALRMRQRGARVLCVGQTGTGKTTELLKVAEELKYEFGVVVPPIDRALDLALLGWHDMIVFACLFAAVQFDATDCDSVKQLAGIAAGENYEWSQIREALQAAPFAAAARRVLPRPTALQRFRNEHAAIKARIEKGPAQVADLCRQASAEIEAKTNKPLIVLLDGTEKMTIEVAERLFHREGRFATELPFRAAIVAPHGILHQDYSAEIGDFFSTQPLILRAISCLPDEPEGRSFFAEMIRARGGSDLIGQEAMDLAIDHSGGYPDSCSQ